MEILKVISFVLLVVILRGAIFAHEGHDHGEAAPQATAQAGPVLLSAEAKKNLDIQTTEAAVQVIEKTVKASGNIEAIAGSRENVSSKISGSVVELNATIGAFVNKGTQLFLLESRQLSESPIRIRILAPRSGKIVKLNVIKGDAVEPGTSLLEIADYREVYAVARVYESQITTIKKSMAARLYASNLKNKAVMSKVEMIGSEVNTQSRTVEVRLRVKNQDEQLKINMNVNVFFLVDHEAETITVPRMAVLGTGGEKFVFVEDENKYIRTAVVTGIENDQWIEIIEGIAPGDKVVTRGNYQLQFAKSVGK